MVLLLQSVVWLWRGMSVWIICSFGKKFDSILSSVTQVLLTTQLTCKIQTYKKNMALSAGELLSCVSQLFHNFFHVYNLYCKARIVSDYWNMKCWRMIDRCYCSEMCDLFHFKHKTHTEYHTLNLLMLDSAHKHVATHTMLLTTGGHDDTLL